VKLRKFEPFTFDHVKDVGRLEGFKYVCGRGEITRCDSGMSNVVFLVRHVL
jgi:hypothetical protein